MRFSSILSFGILLLCIWTTCSQAGSFHYESFNQTAANANDIVALNYALTLEHLENNFYHTGLSTFNNSANFTGYPNGTLGYLRLIGNHEQAHVDTLRAVITQLGGTPVPPCTYTFPNGSFTNISTFLAVARMLENVGVSAYDGAIDTLNSLDLRTAAATIATVEGRHAAFLNHLNGMIPFPQIFDNATAPASIAAMIDSLIGSCNYTLQLPVRAAFNFTATFNFTDFNATSSNPGFQNQFSYEAFNDSAAADNDIVSLNYALTLERLESYFYRTGLSIFNNSANFTSSGFPNTTYSYVTMIGNIENAHVQTLVATITQLGGTPVPQCTYRFPNETFTNVTTFLAVARLLENTGVMAYDGAIDTLNNFALRTAAATIATVEGRFASYLNDILAQVPFPQNFDNATEPAAIASMVAAFIQTCNYTLELPVPTENFAYTAFYNYLASEENTNTGTGTGTGTETGTGTGTNTDDNTDNNTDNNDDGADAASMLTSSLMKALSYLM